jgi:hypothetical protein
MLVFFNMRADWKRFAVILAAGAACGFAWNAASGRGIVLGESVLVQAGDEMVRPKRPGNCSTTGRCSWTRVHATSGG